MERLLQQNIPIITTLRAEGQNMLTSNYQNNYKYRRRNSDEKWVFKKFLYSLGGMASALAVVVTTLNVNTACLYMAHQPKLPDSAKKLRKF